MMTLKEFYSKIDGDYDGAMKRLRSEKLVSKFVLKFLEDTNMNDLRSALAEGNQDIAFRAAHTLKGLCLNIGFVKLGDSTSSLTDALRAEITTEARTLMEQVEADYRETLRFIRELC